MRDSSGCLSAQKGSFAVPGVSHCSGRSAARSTSNEQEEISVVINNRLEKKEFHHHEDANYVDYVDSSDDRSMLLVSPKI